MYKCMCAEPAVVAKSTIVLEVKPWDTETGSMCAHTRMLLLEGLYESVVCVACADMAEVEELVRSIAKDGLLWGACEFHMHTHTWEIFHTILSSS